jgi:hypothetical protein
MKREVYRKKVDTRDELLDLIIDVIARIQERQVLTRVVKCIEVDDGIFENILH